MERPSFLCLLLIASCCLLHTPTAHGEIFDPCGDETQRGTVSQYRSARLNVQTDLPRGKAEALCRRLEDTLALAARYWRRPLKGKIDCFVVDDLENWSDHELAHPLARLIVARVGGATVPRMVGIGRRKRNYPVVYASSEPGTAEHELIHAYCIQTFGWTGPEWYKEGMAEIVVHRGTRLTGLLCSIAQADVLRSAQDLTLREVLAPGVTAKQISAALNMVRGPRRNEQLELRQSGDELDCIPQIREEYLKRWAFCYMLLHNPNYASRFRSLGKVLVSRQHDVFDEFFLSARQQIEFEYAFMLARAVPGYRVDLCRWDWSTRFEPLEANRTRTTLVNAARGFQASGLTVSAGHRYGYEVVGRWSTSGDQDRSTTADGDVDASGRLIGIVFKDFALSEPFPLGAAGTFESPADGQLFLRCEDAWNQLGDNQGQVAATFSLAAVHAEKPK